jgi:hypothetical protein
MSSATFTRFHAEAGIAAAHCFAPSFAETRWNEIAELYAMLERIDPSPLHSLNRAVAVAQGQGPHAGLAALEGVVPPAWLDGHYLWDAVLADLLHRAGNTGSAALADAMGNLESGSDCGPTAKGVHRTCRASGRPRQSTGAGGRTSKLPFRREGTVGVSRDHGVHFRVVAVERYPTHYVQGLTAVVLHPDEDDVRRFRLRSR